MVLDGTSKNVWRDGAIAEEKYHLKLLFNSVTIGSDKEIKALGGQAGSVRQGLRRLRSYLHHLHRLFVCFYKIHYFFK